MDERMFYDLIYNTVRFLFLTQKNKNMFAWQGMPAASSLPSHFITNNKNV